ncbi:MAG: tRNA (adenosine(37)-N6)-threonylcarbamoyltransferase complex ATPase subunit type 1 TsaE [Treponema sp.]|nr:tRNA (adenosine(37)-N6)-threonylcarbamoyltransferase complex ATPase subunit type 1 TsaE [Treponema sp.]
MKFHSSSAEETIALGKKIGSQLKAGDVLALQGSLAAGKTTITKGIALALEIKDTITSPTFCLISEYEGKMPLYHFDVYRLQGSDDFANLGAEDMIYGKGVCLIEWSEKIMDELPKKTIIVRLSVADGDPNARDIFIENWPYGEIK